MEQYYVFLNNSEQGPYTLEQLEEMGITPDTDVWTQGMDDWKPAGDLAEFTELLQRLEFKRHISTPGAPPHRATPPTLPARPIPVAVQEAPLPEPRAFGTPVPHKKKGCFSSCFSVGLIVTIAIVAILLGVMCATVPSRDDHVDAIRQVSNEWIGTKVHEMGLGSILGGVVKMAGSATTDIVIEHMFTYEDHIIYSVGRIDYGQGNPIVSLGMLGHVFTFSKEDLGKAIDKAMQDNMSKISEMVTVPSITTRPNEPQEPEDPDLQPVQAVTGENDTPINELYDTVIDQVKDEAIKVTKGWLKKQIDDL